MDGRTEILAWADHLPTRSLCFVGANEAMAFHDGPGGQRLDVSLAPRGETGPLDYRLDPIETRGRWMKARVVTPDYSCDIDAGDAVERSVWVEYLDARGRPRVWYHTRGC